MGVIFRSLLALPLFDPFADRIGRGRRPTRRRRCSCYHKGSTAFLEPITPSVSSLLRLTSVGAGVVGVGRLVTRGATDDRHPQTAATPRDRAVLDEVTAVVGTGRSAAS